LRLIAAIEGQAIAQRILECIGLPARGPPTTPLMTRPWLSHHDYSDKW
jgi:hypothetical protein